MKFRALLIVAFCLTTFARVDAQDVVTKEAIKTLRDSELMNIFRLSGDRYAAQVDLFVAAIDRQITLGAVKSDRLKRVLLDVAENNVSLIMVVMPGQTPVISREGDAVLRDILSAEEYDLVIQRVSEELGVAMDAFNHLRKLWKEYQEKEAGETIVLFGHWSGQVEQVYDYFGI